jgi:trans-aconitate methyltransferase
MMSADEIKKKFNGRNLNEESQKYIEFHARRYAYLLGIVEKIRNALPARQIRMMDIGPSFFTELLQSRFAEDAIVTLGYDSEVSRGGHFPIDTHYDKTGFFNFDLNEAQYRDKWIKIPACDLAVMAEVIEHLYTAPTLVLNFIHSFLRSGGYLIIQTPNAAALSKRLQLLMGMNPYEMIRETRDNPGHFREYTKNELVTIARKSGFKPHHSEYKNYFVFESFKRAYNLVQTFLPPSMKDGITLVLQKSN